MTPTETLPPEGALDEIRRLAGPSAVVLDVARLAGGQHADTFRVETGDPSSQTIVRQFPPEDSGARDEQRVLRALDGLEGLAPTLLGGDLEGRWSQGSTSLISCLDGEADITPSDPQAWARELGRGLAAVHAVQGTRLAGLPSVLEGRETQDMLHGPLASEVRAGWEQLADAPAVLTHGDYWSGNVVWRGGSLTGIVDWGGGARGPRGYDLGWCRVDLVLLADERLADVFLAAYEAAAGQSAGDIGPWDRWAVARCHRWVETWVPNYAPLGRLDLDERELRRRHSDWTARLARRAHP